MTNQAKDLYKGNECTGDLECLRSFVDVTKVQDNWVIGRVKGHDGATVQIKMFAERSEYGIEDGRISKLHVRDNVKNTEAVNYDRGWDVKPKTAFFRLFVNQLVTKVG